MTLQQTPLCAAHQELGARLVPFAGWLMPVQYEGILAEHRAVRTAMGLFDVCHMGEFEVAGPGAADFLDRAVTQAVGSLALGQCRYGLLCNADGGIIDDLLVYRTGEQTYLLVVNAGNIAADLAWLESLPHPGAELVDISPQTALLALQGPGSRVLMGQLLADPLEHQAVGALKFYRFARASLAGVDMLISRTGYTGEFGYELCFPAVEAPMVWDWLLTAGAADGLVPVGLGARDTLRLEAGLCLHGHDITSERNPLEAGLERFVDFSKEFIGRAALAPLQASGTAEKLVGLRVAGRGIIREHCPVTLGGEPVGEVTSGTFSPTLEVSIGLAYVAAHLAVPGTALEVLVRDKLVACTVVELPFYRRS